MRSIPVALLGFALTLVLSIGSAAAFFCPSVSQHPGYGGPPHKDPSYVKLYDEILKLYGAKPGEAYRIVSKIPDPAVSFAVAFEAYVKVETRRSPGVSELALAMRSARNSMRENLAAANGQSQSVNANDLRALEDMVRRLEAEDAELAAEGAKLYGRLRTSYGEICKHEKPIGPQTTTAVLAMDGPPKPQARFGGFTAIEDGKIRFEDPGYTVTGTWTKIPARIGPEGITLKLKIGATTKSTINTGIQIRASGMEIKLMSGDGQAVRADQLDLPLSVLQHRTEDESKEMAVFIKPSPRYAKSDRPWISVGTFYGVKVEYFFKVENTGEN